MSDQQAPSVVWRDLRAPGRAVPPARLPIAGQPFVDSVPEVPEEGGQPRSPIENSTMGMDRRRPL